jgi:hypothetical protein
MNLRIGVVLLLFSPALACAERAEPLEALAKMPVKEVTVFKDGHAFVLHEGTMPTNAEGNVVLDYLPQPVVGAFWPYAAKDAPKLVGVRAGRRKVAVDRTAITIRELLEGNIGAEAVITETNDGKSYPAVVLGVPRREADESNTAPARNQHDPVSRSGLVMLKTDEGHRAVYIDRIQDVTFTSPPRGTLTEEEDRNLLTLQFDWGTRKPANTAQVGMIYLQKGIRWIPNYKVQLDGKGKATITLQGTLLNELTDLTDVTAHLVVGVPTFAFKDTIDPMALQQVAAQLTPYFHEGSQTALGFSNAIMSQQVRPRNERYDAPHPTSPPMNLGPEITEEGKSEDLYIFTLEHITLRKGERMVVPIATFTLAYEDVYTVNLPFAPLKEMTRSINREQQAELARLFASPKATHVIRLKNAHTAPLTTAPALIFRENRLLAQGMMTYAAPGSTCDLPLTTAVDIAVNRKDVESKRTPNAVSMNGYQYSRVDLKGTVTLTNRQTQPIKLEITRGVLGSVTEADNNGEVLQFSAFDDGMALLPTWVNHHQWGEWWGHLNGIGNIKWNHTLVPGQTLDLNYTWYYYWR